MRLANRFWVAVLAGLLLAGTGLQAQAGRFGGQNRRMNAGGQGGDDEGTIGDFHGGTAAEKQLWEGAFNGQLDQVKSALEQGADVNFRGKGNFTPLVVASRNGYLDIVQYLVEHGAEVDKRDNFRNKSALLAAAFKSHYDIAQYLVEHGADINAQAINGWTPLHDAAFVGDYKTVKMLIDRGARLDILNKGGQTVLQCAEMGKVRAPSHGRTNATPQDYDQMIEYIKSHMKQQ